MLKWLCLPATSQSVLFGQVKTSKGSFLRKPCWKSLLVACVRKNLTACETKKSEAYLNWRNTNIEFFCRHFLSFCVSTFLLSTLRMKVYNCPVHTMARNNIVKKWKSAVPIVESKDPPFKGERDQTKKVFLVVTRDFSPIGLRFRVWVVVEYYGGKARGETQL